MKAYFCGWYYRFQSDTHTLALIPSYHKSGTGNFSMIQLITDTDAYAVSFPFSDFSKHGNTVRIGENTFSPRGISLGLSAPGLDATAHLTFGENARLRYDIMGPFRLVPFMECRHSVFSMRHTVTGTVTVNGVEYRFDDGVGYTEGDRGRSFPRVYAWTQSSFPEGSLMLSVAEIPLGKLRFTGIIGFVFLGGREYRIATYLGAKAEKIGDGEIVVRQGHYRLTVRRLSQAGHLLRAPREGAMTRTIREHPACPVYYRFERDDTVLFEKTHERAAMEYEFPDTPAPAEPC